MDVLEIMESAFVLIGSLIAIMLYASSKVEHGDIKEKYKAAFCELMAFVIFMISQYATIFYIQFHIDQFGAFSTRILVLSGAMSAVSIMYMFVFEYYHLISLLTENKEFTVELQVAYSLFWCPIEYFVWSFVTVNHMLHHLSHHDHHHDHHHDAQKRQRVHTKSKSVLGVADVIDANASEDEMGPELTRDWSRCSTMLFVQPKEEMHLNEMVFAPLQKEDSTDIDIGDIDVEDVSVYALRHQSYDL